MKLNRTLVMCLTIALAAALAIGGSMAYLTSSDGDINTMTIGNVEIDQIEQQRGANDTLVDFVDGKMIPAYYEDVVTDGKITIGGVEYDIIDGSMEGEKDKIVTVSNTGSEAAYVRTLFAFENTDNLFDQLGCIWANGKEPLFPTTTDENTGVQSFVTFTAPDGAEFIVAVYVYDAAVAAGTTSAPSLLQVYWEKETTGDQLAKAGEGYDILVLSQAVQAQMGNLNSAEALNTAFGVVSPANSELVYQWFADANLLPAAPAAGQDGE